jgi:hypothetical protein
MMLSGPTTLTEVDKQSRRRAEHRGREDHDHLWRDHGGCVDVRVVWLCGFAEQEQRQQLEETMRGEWELMVAEISLIVSALCEEAGGRR